MNQAVLPDEVRRQIDEHVDAIERVLLAGGVSRRERRGIVDEVESQIYEMLAERSALEPAAAMTEILARLDPPQAYAPEAAAAAPASVEPPPPQIAVALSRGQRRWWSSGPGKAVATAKAWFSGAWQRFRRWWSAETQQPRVSPPAVVAAIWGGAGLLALFAALSEARLAGPLVALLGISGFTAPMGVTVLGLWAVRRIGRSSGREYGLPLALVEAFTFPVLLLNLVAIGLLAASDGAGLVALATLVVVGGNIALGRYLWRRYGRRFLERVETFQPGV